MPNKEPVRNDFAFIYNSDKTGKYDLLDEFFNNDKYYEPDEKLKDYYKQFYEEN